MANRVGISTNLPTNATEDLLIIQTSNPYPEGQLTFAIGDEPRSITGLQKVAQMFLKILMTTKGSDLVYPSLGTVFNYYSVGSNRIANDRDTYNAILDSIKDAENQVIAATSSGLNDDSSTLQSITVLGLDVNQDSLMLYLQMTTVAGESAAVAVPFPQMDLLTSTS